MDDNQKEGSDRFLAVSILVAAVLIAGSILYVNNGGGGDGLARLAEQAAQEEQGRAPADPKAILDDDVILGDVNAPVSVVIFGDFQCPFCGRLYQNVEPQIKEEYVKTGKVKLVSRDFPLDSIHPYARGAAEAAECARDQGQYWAYRDAVYDRQDQIPTMDYGALAGELGLDVAQFNSCVKAGKYKAEVEKDYQDGLALGVNGTPATFVNGKLISGAQPYSVFKAAIEAELNK